MRTAKKGFTLVEVLVTAGLISVALAITAAVVVTAMNSFARAARLNEAKQLGLAVFSFYENRLITASDIRLEGERPEGWHSLEAAEGRVAADGGALYPEDTYGGFEVHIHARAQGGTLLLTVTVADSTGVAFSRESAVMLANAGAADGAGAAIYYTLGDRP